MPNQLSTPNGTAYAPSGALWPIGAYNRQNDVPSFVQDYFSSARSGDEPSSLSPIGGIDFPPARPESPTLAPPPVQSAPYYGPAPGPSPDLPGLTSPPDRAPYFGPNVTPPSDPGPPSQYATASPDWYPTPDSTQYSSPIGPGLPGMPGAEPAPYYGPDITPTSQQYGAPIGPGLPGMPGSAEVPWGISPRFSNSYGNYLPNLSGGGGGAGGFSGIAAAMKMR